MLSEDFEKQYPELRCRALNVARHRFKDRTLAEESVQNATVYVLSRLERLVEVTPSYFAQLVKNRGLDIIRSEDRRRENREYAVGDVGDLVAVEELETGRRSGRTRPKFTGWDAEEARWD